MRGLMIAFDMAAILLVLASPGFYWMQISSILVGIITLAAGLYLCRSKGK